MTERAAVRLLSFAAVVGLGGVAACGARSSLQTEDVAEPLADASAPRDSAVVRPDAAVPDAFVPIDAADAADTFVPDAPTTCSLACNDSGVSCNVGTCDVEAQACVYKPDDSLCPPGLLCDGVTGCVKILYASTNSALYEVKLPAGTLRAINTDTKTWISDIALSDKATLYALGSLALVTLDRLTGAILTSTPMIYNDEGINSLEVAPDGALYTGGTGPTIYRIDPQTGLTSPVATLPGTWVLSGDLAYLNGTLYATIVNDPLGSRVKPDSLAIVDTTTGAVKIIGDTGEPCVWGLATFESTLYGFTCSGKLVTIDTTTGKATTQANVGIPFTGAASR
jgi:hypothetical protein